MVFVNSAVKSCLIYTRFGQSNTKKTKKKTPYIFPNDQKVYVISYLYFSKKIPTGLVRNALNQFQSVSDLSGESKAVSLSSSLFTSRLLRRSPKVYEPTAAQPPPAAASFLWCR